MIRHKSLGILVASVCLAACAQDGDRDPGGLVVDGVTFDATPYGYYARDCIHEVGPNAVIGEDGAVVEESGERWQAQRCEHAPLTHGVTATAQQGPQRLPRSREPTINGWVASSIWWGAPFAMGSMVVSFNVPPEPVHHVGQTIYYFPGAEDSNQSAIVQPVLGWNQNGLPGWTLASWYCGADICFHGNSLAANVGDSIVGVVSSDGCNAWGGCDSHTITTADWTHGGASTLTKSGDGKVYINLVQGALEVYGVNACDDYPNGTVDFHINSWTSYFGGTYLPGFQPHSDVGLPAPCVQLGIVGSDAVITSN